MTHVARRVLVTGAAGFVGANLVRHAAAAGDEVVAIVRPGGEAWRLDGVEVEVVPADVRDNDAVSRAVARARPDVVFHLAAHGAYSWQGDAPEIMATNVLGTINVLAACSRHAVDAVVHAGSSSEYGFKDHAPTEDEPLEPASDYATAKAAATLLSAEAARAQGLRVVTLRLYSTYGPYEDPDRLVPTLLSHAQRGELPPLVAPDTARDFVHVHDVCRAFALADGAPPGAVYNVGTGRQTTIREVVELVRDLFGIEAEPRWGTMDARSWDTSTWVSNPQRIDAEVGWRARIPLADGILATKEWLEASPALAGRYRLGG